MKTKVRVLIGPLLAILVARSIHASADPVHLIRTRIATFNPDGNFTIIY